MCGVFRLAQIRAVQTNTERHEEALHRPLHHPAAAMIYFRFGHSAACRAGGRTLASPSASVADMVVRTICRGSFAGQGRPRCMVARLSHITTSPLRHV